jgi:hypothetical protein
MTEDREPFNNLSEDGLNLYIELGDESKYPVRGQGTMQFQLELGGSFDAHEVLYVPSLKKNMFSISSMEGKGYEVNFQRGQTFIRPKGASPDTTVTIEVQDGNLYRLHGQLAQTLLHISERLCDLWRKRMGHLDHKALPLVRQMVTGLLEFSLDQHGVCKGCALGNNVNATFPRNKT